MKPQVEEALRKIDSNIEMFAVRIRPDIHPDCLANYKFQLARLKQEREELLAWDADPTFKISTNAYMRMVKMPAWGYKGT